MKLQMTKTLYYYFLTMTLLFGLSACCDDDDDDMTGWYAEGGVPQTSDFVRINRAIEEGQNILYNKAWKRNGMPEYITAEKCMFFPEQSNWENHIFSVPQKMNGFWYNYNSWECEVVANLGNYDDICSKSIIHIVDKNTLVWYWAHLFENGYGNGEELYTVFGGSSLGNLTYCGEPVYYTFALVDNKLVMSNGNIFTITNSGLILEGQSTVWKKINK